MVRYFCVKANENFKTSLWLQCIKNSIVFWIALTEVSIIPIHLRWFNV